MTTDAALAIHELRKTYASGLVRRRTVEALRGVSFEVRRGEIFGLLGPNGAGKTTLIKILLGIVRRTGGEGSLLGGPLGAIEGRRRVGYLPEHHRIPRHHTGNSALAFYGGLSGLSGAQINERRQKMLDLVGLGQWGKTPIKSYSKGMLQRLGLAQAMMHEPELLVLDEPTDGVDPVGRSEIRVLLKKLKSEGITVFINSHLLQEIELVCDRVAILHQGQLQRVAEVEELTRHPETEAIFTLAATEEQIRKALGERKIVQLATATQGQFRVTILLADQVETDRCIDDLRRAGISLCGLERRRQTLEQAFLEIVSRPGGSQ